MQLNIKHIAILPPLLALLTACSWDELLYEDPTSPPLYEKTPIELSVGGENSPEPTTRAVITDGTGKTLNAFDKDAYIFMVMQSDYGTADFQGSHDTKYNVTRGDVAQGQGVVTFTDNNKRYWDDAHARSSQLSIWAYAQKGQKWTTCSFQEITGSDPETSDTYKKTFNTGSPTVWDWQTTRIYPAIREWSVSYSGYPNQTEDDLEKQDLLFSNNLTYNSEKSWPDNRLKFDFTERKFPRDNVMKFYHAMSKITIQLKAGKGFKADGTDFKLKKNGSGNMTIDLLSGLNTKGLFNIKDGEFQQIYNSDDITTIPLTETVVGKSEPYYTLEALAIPNIHEFLSSHSSSDVNSRFKDGSSDVMMQITIDDNTYKITSNDLYDALMTRDGSGNVTTTPVTNATRKTDNGTYVPLEAGKNYVFTFTIGKKEIDNLTAHVAEWEDVEAVEQHPTNARITLNVEDRSGSSSTSPVTSNMDIYRALDEAPSITDTYEGYNWTTGYTTNGKATWQGNTLTYNTNRWSTDWFWESNKTYYHFRTLSPTTQVVTQNAGGDYTIINSASCTSEAGYNQMAWGAPFLDVEDSYKFTYSPTNGFDGTGVGHQIYKAIGPTKDQIKVLMFHMFSGVHFTVKTTYNEDKVQLYNSTGTKRTKVDLVGYYPDGKVLLGTGLVNRDGTISTPASPYNVPCATTETAEFGNQEYFFSAIPQDLTSVKLYITTPDNNQYIVDLWDPEHPITATVTNNNIAIPYAESSTAGKYKINRWYPGFKYNYSFTLAKTGITNLQATIVDWETVTADNETVQIK